MKKETNNTTILITGAKGMLGQEVVSRLSTLPATDYQLFPTDKDTLDITDRRAVQQYFQKTKPNFVVHCAAYVEVDKAEQEKALCKKINVDGTENVAMAAQKIKATTIYISTDYVFDGKINRPYKETDKTNPLGVYAKTKLEGEKQVAKYCKKHYILRVAWLFGKAKGKQNFVDKMIELATKGPVKVINDQVGSPTSTYDLAKAISTLIVRHQKAETRPTYGIYHFSGNGETTRYGFAKEIFRQKKIKANLTPVKTGEFFAEAKRPAYSYLDKTKIERALQLKVQTWQKMLQDYIKERP